MLLAAAESIYRYFYEKRKRRFGAAVQPIEGCRIISVGNITTGGTGKTPAVQWIARCLQSADIKVAVVARGYRGRLSETGAVVSDGRSILLSAANAGDEPVLHARALPGVPVIIGRDRTAAVNGAITNFKPEVIVLDDAFQYWSLPRDLDLVLLDARRPFDNGHLLPRGRLREPPDALQRADAILLTRSGLASEEQLAATKAEVARYCNAPVFSANHCAVALRDESNGDEFPLESLAGRQVGVLSALADNDSFAKTLTKYGASVVVKLARRDHHEWTGKEIRDFSAQAGKAGATALLTTEKDAVKIQSSWSGKLPLFSVKITMDFGAGEPAFRQLILSVVGKSPKS